MKKPKLSPDEFRARAYATMLCDALWLAAAAYEGGNDAQGRKIECAVQVLVDAFCAPDGLPGFPSAFEWVKAEILREERAQDALGDSQARFSRLH